MTNADGSYAIRLATGELQPLSVSRALTNAQADALLGGGAEVVWLDAEGRVQRLDVFAPYGPCDVEKNK